MLFRFSAPLFSVLLASVTLVAGCVIATPPPDIPALPNRPAILHNDVVPPPSRVLASWPDTLVVPVQLVDSEATFEWRVYVDYDPHFGHAGTPPHVDGVSAPQAVGGAVRQLSIALDPGAILIDSLVSTCHIIELIVAPKFASNVEHTPEGEGDSVVWFLSSGNDLSACVRYSAGGAPHAGDAGT